MHILAIPPAVLAARLRRALGSLCDVELVSSADELTPSRVSEADVVVLDPNCHATRGEIHWAYVGGASKVVVYTSPYADEVRTAMIFARAGGRAFILAGSDDSHEALRRAVLAAFTSSLSRKLLDALKPRLESLPPLLRDALTRAIGDPQTGCGAATVCHDARTARRSCDRWIQGAGLKSLDSLLRAAKIARAVPLLREPHLSVALVATLAGFRSARALGASTHTVLGIAPTALAKLTDAKIVDGLVRYAQVRSPNSTHVDSVAALRKELSI